MTFRLFSQVQLTEDIPEFNHKRGSVGIIVEHYPVSQGEDGYSVEVEVTQNAAIIRVHSYNDISQENIEHTPLSQMTNNINLPQEECKITYFKVTFSAPGFFKLHL